LRIITKDIAHRIVVATDVIERNAKTSVQRIAEILALLASLIDRIAGLIISVEKLRDYDEPIGAAKRIAGLSRLPRLLTGRARLAGLTGLAWLTTRLTRLTRLAGLAWLTRLAGLAGLTTRLTRLAASGRLSSEVEGVAAKSSIAAGQVQHITGRHVKEKQTRRRLLSVSRRLVARSEGGDGDTRIA